MFIDHTMRYYDAMVIDFRIKTVQTLRTILKGRIVVMFLLCFSVSHAWTKEAVSLVHKIPSPAVDTTITGLGYMSNSDVLGIWGVNSSSTSPIISITPAQNVGIGTTNPPSEYRLAVNGSAIFTRIKVKEFGTWPDYVFQHNYSLPTLKELEAYIKQYRHLPGIPSAVDAEKKELDIAENQTALLRKIEELTLYIIDQNKKIEDQAKRLELLEHRTAK